MSNALDISGRIKLGNIGQGSSLVANECGQYEQLL